MNTRSLHLLTNSESFGRQLNNPKFGESAVRPAEKSIAMKNDMNITMGDWERSVYVYEKLSVMEKVALSIERLPVGEPETTDGPCAGFGMAC